MITRDSLTVVSTELVLALKNSGGKLEAAIAAVAVSVDAPSEMLLPSDKTIVSSKFSGLGGSVVVRLVTNL